jgi:CDP-glucose 4,6-dehydratase
VRYLITGHTGFKGAWLSLMLANSGHEVFGLSLDPDEQSLFESAKLSGIFSIDRRLDIRDKDSVDRYIKQIDPEVVIHLAAQPLVRYSYQYPIETYSTNVMGTLNVLEATRSVKSLLATLIITTDKVYKNIGQRSGYVESDPLGGDDPYSASKAAADIATQSWIKSFSERPVAIARAGNVIGGGDWASDRLIPDLVRSYSSGVIPIVRNPLAVRPWQHVLDCLNGYTSLIDSLLAGRDGGEWNFGPNHMVHHIVSEVVETFAQEYGFGGTPWKLDTGVNPHESNFLLLDSSKSRNELGWVDLLDFHSSIAWTADWYKTWDKGGAKSVTLEQIDRFNELRNLSN